MAKAPYSKRHVNDKRITHLVCNCCGEFLPVSSFYICGPRYRSYCKQCIKGRRSDGNSKLKRRYQDDPIFRQSVIDRSKQRYQDNKKEIMESVYQKRFGGKREDIIGRDGYRCTTCGLTREEHLLKYDCDIEVHHLDGLGRDRKRPNNRTNNLITLCKSCHATLHQTTSIN